MLVFCLVWPIQLHFHLNICLSIGSWSALLHNSLLGILSSHLIPSIDCKQLLTKVLILCWFVLVVCNVSQPYSKTVFMFELKIVNFELMNDPLITSQMLYLLSYNTGTHTENGSLNLALVDGTLGMCSAIIKCLSQYIHSLIQRILHACAWIQNLSLSGQVDISWVRY